MSATRKGSSSWLLLFPALSIVLVFFGIPALYMVRMSLNGHEPQSFYTPGFTFENYIRIFSDPLIAKAVWNTVQLSLTASSITVVIAYCFALLVWFKPVKWRLWFVGLALLPLLISEIATIFGWYLVFPKNGLLSFALLSMGLITDKISLMYTESAALVGLVYITLPYCFFILLSVFDGLDRRTLEAGSDLGAAPLALFREVLFPQTRAGVLTAFAQAFIWTMGTYATPMALGPDAFWTLGFMIQDQMLAKHHWPMAAALSVVLVVGVASVILLTRKLQPERRSFHV